MHRNLWLNCYRQVKLAEKDITLLAGAVLILCGVSLPTGKNFISLQFTLSSGTYSINDFNPRINVAVLQQRQDWKYLKLQI